MVLCVIILVCCAIRPITVRYFAYFDHKLILYSLTIVQGYAASIESAEMQHLVPAELHENHSLLFDNIELILQFHSGYYYCTAVNTAFTFRPEQISCGNRLLEAIFIAVRFTVWLVWNTHSRFHIVCHFK